jgi:hypothetical protein
MVAKMKNSICYNCGTDQADTREHVIAKTLIPEPRPGNLITVPACRKCNESFSRDEEYLRDRLSATVAGAGFDAPKTWDIAWRSMKRPEAKGKKLAFFKEVSNLPFTVQTKNGLSDMSVELAKSRVNRVIEKMVRGFYFHHFNAPLGDVDFEMDLLSSINPTGNRKALMEVLEKIHRSPTWAQNFGPHTHVICALMDDDDRAGMWSFKFFGQHIAFAVVVPKLYFERHDLGNLKPAKRLPSSSVAKKHF